VGTGPGAPVKQRISSNPLVNVNSVLFEPDEWYPQMLSYNYLKNNWTVLDPKMQAVSGLKQHLIAVHVGNWDCLKRCCFVYVCLPSTVTADALAATLLLQVLLDIVQCVIKQCYNICCRIGTVLLNSAEVTASQSVTFPMTEKRGLSCIQVTTEPRATTYTIKARGLLSYYLRFSQL
jgi:hypothetical protein